MIGEIVRKWVERADLDLLSAKRLLEDGIYEYSLFHSQQAVEKYLKAFLTKNQLKFGKTHNIARLIELCKTIDRDFEYLFDIKADKLYPKGIDVRYPEFEYEISEEDAREALEIAEKARDFVLKKLREQQ